MSLAVHPISSRPHVSPLDIAKKVSPLPCSVHRSFGCRIELRIGRAVPGDFVGETCRCRMLKKQGSRPNFVRPVSIDAKSEMRSWSIGGETAGTSSCGRSASESGNQPAGKHSLRRGNDLADALRSEE